jgi:hypothetical protein
MEGAGRGMIDLPVLLKEQFGIKKRPEKRF